MCVPTLGVLALLIAAAPARAEAPREHEVAHGDTLGGIAKRYGCTVKALQKKNRIKGHVIVVGKSLKLPKSCKQPPEGSLKAAGKVVTHTVLPGETLGHVAKRYDTTVDAIKRRNRLKGTTIKIGQKLKVKTKVAVRERRKVVYRIQAGDTLSEIAHRFGMSWKEIQALNPRKDPEHLKIGDKLTLYFEGPSKSSETVGRPNAGKLVNGEQLPKGPGYYRRRPKRAWGTNETISTLLKVIAAVRAKHPKVHDIAIGDISDKDGGLLPPHKSHQSGRDVDIGYYFKKQPKVGPKRFMHATRNTKLLDFEATWTLIKEFTGTSPKNQRAAYIFMNYKLQKILYEWAKDQGVSKKVLSHVFQYPRGKRAMRGVIRHEPGHTGHMHIRFKCPKGDEHCV